VGEWQLFESGTVPEWTQPWWYEGRERAAHLEQELHRPRLMEAAAQIIAAAAKYGAKTLVDLGAGDGGLLQLLQVEAPSLACWGYDLQPSNVAGAAERGVDVRLGDVVAGAEHVGRSEDGTMQKLPIQWGDIAVATECLEHLLDPHRFVRTVASHMAGYPDQRTRILVASSPYTERPGAAYGFHTWAWDLDGYRALMEQGGFEVVRQEPVGMFQVVTAVRL
jgi:2-polyprenyl-3-methyl-5-hydroxy-6-metoxy-1,4-benzoquinol methylase